MGGGHSKKGILLRGAGGSCEKNWQAEGVIQFHTNTPPNPTSPPYPLKNERSLGSLCPARSSLLFLSLHSQFLCAFIAPIPSLPFLLPSPPLYPLSHSPSSLTFSSPTLPLFLVTSSLRFLLCVTCSYKICRADLWIHRRQ